MKKKTLLSVVVALAAVPAFAVEPKEEVEVSAGPVTALSCALQAMKTGDLSLLGSACPMAEVKSGLVIVDVAERQIYVPTSKNLAKYQLESAFGGGSIDFEGVVKKVDKAGVATVEIGEFTVNKKKKAGSFKGCL
jgi:hypothetical protein